jgi:hypothetical protein
MSQYVGNEIGIRPVQPEGISLRDWFAVHAMAGVAANPLNESLFTDEDYDADFATVFMDLAESAYAIADAMLAARALPPAT